MSLVSKVLKQVAFFGALRSAATPSAAHYATGPVSVPETSSLTLATLAIAALGWRTFTHLARRVSVPAAKIGRAHV